MQSNSDSDSSDLIAEDNSDGFEMNEEQPLVYKENFWPAKPEEPKGFTFKGKSKMLTYAVEKAKATLKKGIENEANGKKFKILDQRKTGGATQITIEISDNEGRGNAIIDFWGPNKKKECTVLIKKSKEHGERFVKIAAKDIVKPLLDCFIAGRDSKSIFNNKETLKRQQCDVCEKTFASSKYLKIHITKIHTASKNKCDHCEFSDNDKIRLRSHIKTEHTDNVAIKQQMETQQTEDDNPTKTDNLEHLEKVSFEEKRIDDVLMDTLDDVTNESNQIEKDELQRSRLRDDQIKIKENKRQHEDENYIRKKANEEPSKKKMKNKKKSVKKSLKKKKKKEETKNQTSMGNELPTNLANIPENIKHLVGEDDMIVRVEPDGACGLNSAAGHIFEDPEQGSQFRHVINVHMVDRWDYYNQKIVFPYRRQIGASGDWVHFQAALEFLNFLRNDKNAAFLWTDSEEIHAIANLYQINIKIITTNGSETSKPVLNIIGPDSELRSCAILPP